MPNSLENQFIADTFKALLHTGNISLSSGSPDAKIYSGDGFESSLTVSTASNGIKVSGNATIDGDVISEGDGSFIGSLNSGSHTVTGNSDISGTVKIGGNTTISGSLSSGSHRVIGNSNISGNSNIGGSLNSGSHTVTGNSNISGTVEVGGNTTISGSLNSGSHTVTGNSNISGTTSITGSLSSGSHTVTGNSRITNRIDVNQIYANTYLNLPGTLTTADVVDHIYPIGSIVFSFAITGNPSSRFTGTTWTQIATGRFIVGVGTGNDGIQNRVFAAGNNPGSYEHTLQLDEMPIHSHTISNNGGTVSDSGSGDTASPANGTNGTSGTSGGDQPHENTPPGFGLYVWQRTA